MKTTAESPGNTDSRAYMAMPAASSPELCRPSRSLTSMAIRHHVRSRHKEVRSKCVSKLSELRCMPSFRLEVAVTIGGSAQVRCRLAADCRVPAGPGPPARAQRLQQRRQRLRCDGLGKVVVETGIQRLTSIAVLAPARHRDKRDVLAPVSGADAPGQLVTIEVGKTDVEQQNIGVQLPTQLERLLRRVGGSCHMTAELQQHGAAVGGVAIVVHDEDLQRIFRREFVHIYLDLRWRLRQK